MIRVSSYRRVSLLVLAGYLASGTLGMLWHEHLHDHGHAHEHAAAEAACHEHDHGDGHEHNADRALADHQHDEQESALHDNDCIVCRLAGQRTIEVPVTELAACSGLCYTLSIPTVASPALAVPGLAQSRAPPTLG